MGKLFPAFCHKKREHNLPLLPGRQTKNLLILSETEGQTFKKFFNLLITNANEFSATLKTVQFDYFLPE